MKLTLLIKKNSFFSPSVTNKLTRLTRQGKSPILSIPNLYPSAFFHLDNDLLFVSECWNPAQISSTVFVSSSVVAVESVVVTRVERTLSVGLPPLSIVVSSQLDFGHPFGLFGSCILRLVKGLFCWGLVSLQEDCPIQEADLNLKNDIFASKQHGWPKNHVKMLSKESGSKKEDRFLISYKKYVQVWIGGLQI
ncbi:hypothetical protein GQ457_13G001350 [Hibiscus cannabinus]